VKECTKCKEIKELCEFSKDKRIKSGLCSRCKSCRKLDYNKDKARVSELRKLHYNNNKEQTLKNCHDWYINNKDRKSKQEKEYRSNNKDKINKRYNEKMKNNPIFKLARLVRSRLRSALKNNYKSGSAVRDLGCSIKDLKIHLEQQFQEGMNWDNHGKWHIDHIKPLVSFDLTKREELLEACNYTNLQPLWAKDNLSKGCKIV